MAIAPNTSPIFGFQANVGLARLTSGAASRDGSSATSCFTAATNGSRVDWITFRTSSNSPSTTSDNIGVVYVTDTGGSNPRNIAEVLMPSVAVSATILGSSGTVSFQGGLFLAPGQQVMVQLTVYSGAQDDTDVVVRGGDY